jgi:hypothetical protein
VHGSQFCSFQCLTAALFRVVMIPMTRIQTAPQTLQHYVDRMSVSRLRYGGGAKSNEMIPFAPLFVWSKDRV